VNPIPTKILSKTGHLGYETEGSYSKGCQLSRGRERDFLCFTNFSQCYLPKKIFEPGKFRNTTHVIVKNSKST